jgi:hypothetical protein
MAESSNLLEGATMPTSASTPAASVLGIEPAQADLLMRGITSAVRGDGELSPTQADILSAVGRYVLGTRVPAADAAPLSPGQLADGLADERLRHRAVDAMIALESMAVPVDPAVTARVEEYAKALHFEDDMLAVARDYGRQAMDVAQGDLIRNSYPSGYAAAHGRDLTLHETVLPASPIDAPADPGLAATWRQLETCRSGSLGRTVWDFYQHRGFSIPGTPGAVTPLLAQHDFVHCLADYGTSALGEIEVFTFIASSIPDPKGFFYLLVIVGLFETGYVQVVPGVATASSGHLSTPGGPPRFADALRRGLEVHTDVMGGVDWFQFADTPIDDVRRHFGVPTKHPDAVAAGSLSATDPRAVFGAD